MISLKIITPEGNSTQFGNFPTVEVATIIATKIKPYTELKLEVSHQISQIEATLMGLPHPTEIIYQI